MTFGIVACSKLVLFSLTCHFFIYAMGHFLKCLADRYEVCLQRCVKMGSELNPFVYMETSTIHIFVSVTSLHICDNSDELILFSYNKSMKNHLSRWETLLFSNSEHWFISQIVIHKLLLCSSPTCTRISANLTWQHQSAPQHLRCTSQHQVVVEGWLPPSHSSNNITAWPN